MADYLCPNCGPITNNDLTLVSVCGETFPVCAKCKSNVTPLADAYNAIKHDLDRAMQRNQELVNERHPKSGDIVEWTETDENGNPLPMRAQVIVHNAQLWLNGCGSLEHINKLYRLKIVVPSDPPES